jgi:hypothetical protein
MPLKFYDIQKRKPTMVPDSKIYYKIVRPNRQVRYMLVADLDGRELYRFATREQAMRFPKY